MAEILWTPRPGAVTGQVNYVLCFYHPLLYFWPILVGRRFGFFCVRLREQNFLWSNDGMV